MASNHHSEDGFKADVEEEYGKDAKLSAVQIWRLLEKYHSDRASHAALGEESVSTSPSEYRSSDARVNVSEYRQFTSLRSYKRERANLHFWWSAINRVCERHQLVISLAKDNVRTGLQPSTHPVFIIDNRLVIKFYENRLYASGDRNFRVERDLYSWLQLRNLVTPQLLASGTMDEWPYIVTTVVPGVSYGEMMTKITSNDRDQMAALLGQTLRDLHQIPLDSRPILVQMWDEFAEFIKEQASKCVKRHRRWHTLPERLIEQIPSYLTQHECSKTVCLVHADVSCNHVFGFIDPKDEHWHTTGLIDFGDARVGDPIYELVVLHCSLFELDTRLLRAFLQTYQLSNDRIVHRAMVAMLLFEFNIFKTVIEHRPEIFPSAKTLEELAETIWSIEEVHLI